MRKHGRGRSKTDTLSVKISAIALLLTLVGCSSAPAEQLSAPTLSPSPTVLSLRDFDLGNTDWKLGEGYENKPRPIVKLQDGKSVSKDDEKLSPSYKLGDIVYSDLNDDGVEDAAATLEYSDGNAYATFMYLWLADEQKPKQLLEPIAVERSCGDSVNKVTAVPGGIKIMETRRTMFDTDRSCAQGGTWKETRTISVEQIGKNKTWLPVQTAPKRGYGGICNEAIPGDILPFDEPYYLAPYKATKQEFAAHDQIRGISIAGNGMSTTEDSEPEGWKLYNVVEKDDSVERCIWLPVT